jgi:reactive intermediate/imine deaminase
VESLFIGHCRERNSFILSTEAQDRLSFSSITFEEITMSRSVRVSLAITLLLATLSAADLPAQETREFVNPGSASDPASSPYSGAVLVGNTLYLAGTIGLTADDKVPETAAEEARLVLGDLQKTLQSAGMSMDDLVSVQVFCSDVKHYAEFNNVYRGYFNREFPARAFIGVGTLLYGARFEVQGIAVKRETP